jgi:UDP-N-acetylglucosamine 2-epimerase (hydrolysing)
MSKKKIIFVTGTRADYGKLKSLILTVKKSKKFSHCIFITGMHNLKNYGNTYEEILKDNIKNYYRFNNQKLDDSMETILSKTIVGFAKYLKKEKPDLVVIHGDRVEALAVAIVCSLNNILLAHIEGGEVSGTVDEMLRHSISKLSHLHFVSNRMAKTRLIQMGEDSKKIFIIGSPDIDIMKSGKLPSLFKVKKRYNFNFKSFGILLFHPVTTEIDKIKKQTITLCKAIKHTKKNFIIIYPNNDTGAKIILNIYFKEFKNNKYFVILPSMRFEYFLTLLKNSNLIIGNSSAAIREAPFYGTTTINLGTRQFRRTELNTIINLNFNKKKITKSILNSFHKNKKNKVSKEFGNGSSAKKFLKILNSKNFFDTQKQKFFKDI